MNKGGEKVEGTFTHYTVGVILFCFVFWGFFSDKYLVLTSSSWYNIKRTLNSARIS